MRKWIITAGWMAMIMGADAQTFSEWFRQHKTQIKYLHQQILALQTLAEDTKDGNGIVQRGTNVIGWLLQQDQDQHKDYFAALWVVEPLVQEDGRIGTIRTCQMQVTLDCQACRKVSEAGIWLRPNEQLIVDGTVGDLMDRAKAYGDVLDRIIGEGYLEMRDDERMERIEEICEVMKRLWLTARDFRQLVEGVILFRQWKIKDGEGIMRLYGQNYRS